MTEECSRLRIFFKKPEKCFGNSAMFVNNLGFALLLLPRVHALVGATVLPATAFRPCRATDVAEGLPDL